MFVIYMWIKIFKKLFQKKNNLPTYPPMINIMGRVTATKVSFMGSLRVRLVPLIFLYFLYLGSMCKTPPKFYIGLNRQKSQNFPKSLWMLKYWILRYKTWIQSSLGSKMRWGGGVVLKFDYPILTFLVIKSIIFELGSKIVGPKKINI